MAFIGISILITVIPISITYTLNKNNLEDTLNKEGAKDTKISSVMIGNWLQERINEVEIYAQNPLVKTMNWEVIKKYLKSEEKREDDLYAVSFISDLYGNYSTTDIDHAGNIRYRTYFKKVVTKGETVLSNPVISKSTNKPIAVIAAPIKNDTGRIKGVIGRAIDLEKLYNHIENIRFEHPDSYSFILDKNGQIVTYPDKELIMSRDLINYSEDMGKDIIEKATKVLNNEYGYVKFNYKGKPNLFYYNEIPNTDGWQLVTKVPQSYLYTPINNIYKSIIVSLGLGLIIIFIFGYIFVNTISKPILKLNNLLKKASSGDLAVRSEHPYNDEVGQVSDSFNKMMDNINRLTYTDTLTDLPNRKVFQEQLELSINYCKTNNDKLPVFILGLDRFRNINDTLGHNTGDELIKRVSQRLKEQINDQGIVGRLGREDFGIVMYSIKNYNKMISVIEDILDDIKRPYRIEDHELYITSSIGVAIYPRDGKEYGTLIKNANIAMGRAKEIGGNAYQLYRVEMKNDLVEQLSLDANMRYGLQNNEFYNYYQPIIDITTGEIVAVEALVRWIHPNIGLISPAKFIPLAEENGLILPLGETILRNACSHVKKLHNEGYPKLSVSVNISTIQFEKEGFVKMVKDILREEDLEPRFLKLEITESIVVKDISHTINILNELRAMEVSISIDDFGTGYSSLGYLREFAINTLKIDKSFVMGLMKDKKNEAIISTIISIAKNLELEVIAEGVETEKELKFLSDEKCNYAQGYYFSKPVAFEELKKLLN